MYSAANISWARQMRRYPVVVAVHMPSSPTRFCMLYHVFGCRTLVGWVLVALKATNVLHDFVFSGFQKPWPRHAAMSAPLMQLGGRRSQPTDHSIEQIVQQEHLSLSDAWMIVYTAWWLRLPPINQMQLRGGSKSVDFQVSGKGKHVSGWVCFFLGKKLQGSLH